MQAQIAFGLDEVHAEPSAVAIGFFDGVHRGHQSLIARTLKAASEKDLRAVVVTFDRHPLEVVNPGARPPLLMTLNQRLQALAERHVDLVVALPFDDSLRHLSPKEFVAHVLAGPLQAQHVVVGSNFRFGHKAAGDVTTLADLGPGFGFTSEGVTLLQMEGVVISSTQIRSAIEAGNVEQAASWLGRPHVLDGIVVRGDQRGRTLGFPTANLQVDSRSAVPAPGVYAGRFRLRAADGKEAIWQPSAISIGTNPTFGGVTKLRIESHLLDFDGDLYGVQTSQEFTHRLRDQVTFDGVEDLVAQMHEDIASARRLLAD